MIRKYIRVKCKFLLVCYDFFDYTGVSFYGIWANEQQNVRLLICLLDGKRLTPTMYTHNTRGITNAFRGGRWGRGWGIA